MKQKHFLLSIKTIDDSPLFHESVDGEKLLFPFLVKAMNQTNVVFKMFAGFPTGVEVILWCNDEKEAKSFADNVCFQIYDVNNKAGYIIDCVGVHIGYLTDDERTLEAVATDIMSRSMAARGHDFKDIPTVGVGFKGDILS